MTHKRAIGNRWERVAESFLRARGLRTVMRNFQCRQGEIDLIMKHEDCLVFAEVRYRRSPRYGSGAESVTRPKQQRIIRAAKRFLQTQDQFAGRPCRFDVLSLSHQAGDLNVTWVQDAFTSD